MKVLVPDIGDVDAVEVIEILVSEGETVEVDQSLITLESDKASMEVPSPVAGTVRSLALQIGDEVAEGAVILEVEEEAATADANAPAAGGAAPGAADSKGDQISGTQDPRTTGAEAGASEVDASSQSGPAAATPTATAPAAGGAPQAPRRATPPVTRAENDDPASLPYASPGVRRFARELGVDLTRVVGTGPKDRILKDDVQGFVKEAMRGAASIAAEPSGAGIPAIPAIDFSKFGPVEEVELSRIRKLSAANLHRSWLNVPRVTQFDEADITELEAFRKQEKAAAAQRDIKLTPLAFLLKASASALADFPDFRSSLHPEGDRLIRKNFTHIGVAVDTPNGLVVPVIRDVDQKSLLKLADELGAVSERARKGRLTPTDIQGACFTISSLGGIGGTGFTPIINAPEVAILGVARSKMTPVWRDGEFVPRLILPFSVAYDHRVIDGAYAVRFTTHLSGLLSDIRRMIL